MGRNQWPAIPRVQDPESSPEPSVERAVETVLSMGGWIGTHMLLWAPSQDSVVKPWDWSLHSRDSESRGGAHRVAPEVVFELEAQAEAKLHMYYCVLRWWLNEAPLFCLGC
jgi:hypothetical protein